MRSATVAALMAPRKKSSSKQPNVGAWLGGNKGYVLSGSNTDTSAKVDSGGGQAEAVRGELGLGAYAAGVGAAGAVGAGVAAVRSGAVGRAINKMGDKTVLLHGSPVSGLRNIEPRVPPKGPNASKGARVYGIRTDVSPKREQWLASIGVKKDELKESTSVVAKYARGTFDTSKPKTAAGGGSVYVIRTSKKTTDLSPDLLERGITATSSTERGRVVGEVKLKNKSDEQIFAEVQKKLRRAGVKVPKKK